MRSFWFWKRSPEPLLGSFLDVQRYLQNPNSRVVSGIFASFSRALEPWAVQNIQKGKKVVECNSCRANRNVQNWAGANAKRSKLFSSANGAKTEQTVRGARFFFFTFGTKVTRTQGPDLESEHTATLGRLQWPSCRAHSQVGPLSHRRLIQGDPRPHKSTTS